VALAYVRFRLRRLLLEAIGRRFDHFSMLGRRLHFSDSASFQFLLWELFIEESYGDCEVVPKTIIDCGSNIGMSVLFFKTIWPDAAITAIEASPSMFALLAENLAGLPGVTLVSKAVSDHHGTVEFYSGGNTLIGSTHAARAGGAAVTVDAMPLSAFVTGPVDLLKVDIEGAEIDAVADLAASGKMSLVRRMFIEYHHHLPGEQQSLSSFLHCLESNGFDYEILAAPPHQPGAVQDILIRAKRT
jgi:FkbM family methyltransferase